MGTAVVVIDMINDFVTGKFENERAQRIVPNIEKLIESARTQEIPVIYVSDSHSEGDPEFSLWGTHAIEGTEGSEIVPKLKPEDEDYTFRKEKYSIFFDTEVENLFEELDIDRVVLTGVLAHICIQHSAADAFFRGYEVVVAEDGVEDLSDEKKEDALNFMEENYGAEILKIESLLERWG